MPDLSTDHRIDAARSASPPEPLELAGEAALAADDRKATGLLVLEVGPVLGLAELFLLATASNERQLKAVAEAIEERLRDRFGQRPLRREGDPPSGWMLLDYGDVVCHLFLPEQRGFYDLERLWGDVEQWQVVASGPGSAPIATSGSGDGADEGWQ